MGGNLITKGVLLKMAKNENGKVTEKANIEQATEVTAAEIKAAQFAELEKAAAQTAEVTAAAEVAESEEEETEVAEEKADFEKNYIPSGLRISRSKYKVGDKDFWNYYSIATLRNKPLHADFTQPKDDRGCFALLDFIFGDSKQIDLGLIRYVVVDEKTKKKTKGFTYEAYTIDPDGKIYHCKIVPKGASDKSILDMYLSDKGIRA